jgi:hypothetical protein
MRWTPSIVPNGTDQTVYIVLDDFGKLGRAYPETDPERADLETVISDLISGQFNNPVRVAAFNTAEHWAEDASEDIAREILRRLDLAGDELPSSLEASLPCDWPNLHIITDGPPLAWPVPRHCLLQPGYGVATAGPFARLCRELDLSEDPRPTIARLRYVRTEDKGYAETSDE